MAHKRTLIRAAVKALLAGNTDAGNNVFTSRKTNYLVSELPAINIRLGDEEATPRDIRGLIFVRNVALLIEIKASDMTTLDDTLDNIAEEVETALNADKSLGGLVHGTIYRSTSEVEIDEDGNKPIGSITLTFNIQYSI